MAAPVEQATTEVAALRPPPRPPVEDADTEAVDTATVTVTAMMATVAETGAVASTDGRESTAVSGSATKLLPPPSATDATEATEATDAVDARGGRGYGGRGYGHRDGYRHDGYRGRDWGRREHRWEREHRGFWKRDEAAAATEATDATEATEATEAQMLSMLEVDADTVDADMVAADTVIVMATVMMATEAETGIAMDAASGTGTTGEFLLHNRTA